MFLILIKKILSSYFIFQFQERQKRIPILRKELVDIFKNDAGAPNDLNMLWKKVFGWYRMLFSNNVQVNSLASNKMSQSKRVDDFYLGSVRWVITIGTLSSNITVENWSQLDKAFPFSIVQKNIKIFFNNKK